MIIHFICLKNDRILTISISLIDTPREKVTSIFFAIRLKKKFFLFVKKFL